MLRKSISLSPMASVPSKADGSKQLISSCYSGDVAAVSKLLSIGGKRPVIDLNYEDEDKMTALKAACIRGHGAVVAKLLAQSEIDINSGKNSATALHMACGVGYSMIVAQLLAYSGIDCNQADVDGMPPLLWAVHTGHREIVAQLLACSEIDVNSRNNFDGDNTPLISACRKGSGDIAALLLNHPRIDVNKATVDGFTPLMYASQGHGKIVAQLLAHGDININRGACKDKGGSKPLLLAAQDGHADIVAQLIARSDIDIDQTCSMGRTALCAAAQNGFSEIVAMLIARSDVDINHKGYYGQTPLMMASYMGHSKIVAQLLAHPGIDFMYEKSDGGSAIKCASQQQHSDIVTMLVEKSTEMPQVLKDCGFMSDMSDEVESITNAFRKAAADAILEQGTAAGPIKVVNSVQELEEIKRMSSNTDPSDKESNVNVCDWCGSRANLRCPCKSVVNVYYCSKACQKKAWPTHKNSWRHLGAWAGKK